MSLLEMLQQHLDPNAIAQISQRLGTDPGATANAVDSAVPLLLAALGHKSADPASAGALATAVTRDHDGSLLDNLPLFLKGGQTADGEGVLRHVLGDRTAPVTAGISQASGLDQSKVARLLPLLAPVVMAALGRVARNRNLDAGGLSTLLGAERQRLSTAAPGIMGALGGLLDRNHDGSIADDAAGLLGSVFGGKR